MFTFTKFYLFMETTSEFCKNDDILYDYYFQTPGEEISTVITYI